VERQLRALGEATEDSARVNLVELDRRAVVEVGCDRTCRGPEGADLHAALDRVGTEDSVRVGVLAANQCVELGGGDGSHL
jgi:hypothetical protein